MQIINTSGRRKTAVARIYMKQGNGDITVNHKNFKLIFESILLFHILNAENMTC